MDDILDPMLARDLRAAGLPLPTTPDAVRRFDDAFGPPPPLPPELADPDALYERLTTSRPARILPFLSSRSAEQDAVDQSLAMAAREGRALSPEALAEMQRLRDANDAPAG